MKKIICLILAAGLIFGNAVQTMAAMDDTGAWDDSDLLLGIYNVDYLGNEIIFNLGDVSNLDFTQSNVILGQIELSQIDVSAWEDLRMEIVGYTKATYSPYFATINPEAPGVATSAYAMFTSNIGQLYTEHTKLDGDEDNIVVHAASGNSNTFGYRMDMNYKGPGAYAGLNTDNLNGQAELDSLDEGGVVQVYLYKFNNLEVLDPDDDGNASTPYIGIIQIDSDGTITLNPPLPSNDPPVISGTPATSVNEDQPYSFTPAATDPEGDDLTFSINTTPSWATFTSSTGELSGTPGNGDVGTTTGIVISVSDGTNTVSLPAFNLTVNAVNDPPVISGTPITSVNEGIAYSFTPTASDEEGAELTFSINITPSWATFTSSTGELSGIPGNGDAGTTTGIVISVSDGVNTVSLPSFNLTVTAVNDPPEISGTPSTSVDEDQPYSFTPAATDPEGDDLTFSINTTLSWASFNASTGELSGTPGNGDVGTTTGIVISVSDGENTVSLPSFSLTVTAVNDPPVIGGTPITSVDEDTAYRFIPTASDEEGVELTFSINITPSWASFNTSTGELSGTPGNSDVGTTTGIIISVSDGPNNDSLPSFNLTVVNTNDVPTISGTPATAVLQDEEYSFIPTANDVDIGDTLTYSIENKPEWASFNTETGELTGTPSSDDIGTTTGIVISVTDGHSPPVSLPAFNLKVSSSNEPPVISGSPGTAVDEDSLYLFTPAASDPDGDELIFSIENKPEWASFNTETGELSGTPTNEDVGTTSGIIISVSDSIVAPVSLSAFSITVNNINDIPVIGGAPLTEIEEGSSYSFTPSASDDDLGDILTFSIVNQPVWASFNTLTGELSGIPSNSDVGITSGIIISVTDGNSSPVSLPSFDLEVINLNDAPTIDGTPATSVNEDSMYSFVPIANDVDAGDILSFSIINQPEWASFDPSTGALTGTPVNDDVGTTTGIIISVTDGHSNPVSLPAFSLEVINVNDAPEISEIADRTIIQNGSFDDIDLNEYVEDVDNNDSEIDWTFTADETNLEFNIDENNILSVSILDQDWIGSVEATLTATDPDGASDSEIVTFSVTPAPPTMPGVNFPADGSEVTDNPPVLSINNSTSVVGELTYDFELATDEAFVNIIASDYDYPEGETITSWDLGERFPSLELDENSTYYWRARALDSNTDSGWMNTASFIINEFNEQPSVPTVSYPNPGSQISSLTPALEIINSTDPDNDDLEYRFEVYNFEFSDNTDPGGTPIISGQVTEESDGTTSYQIVNTLTDNMSYWWRIRAEETDSSITSTWAGPFKFTVNSTPNAPTRPELISPDTNGEVETYNPELIISNSTDEDIGDVITYIFQIDKVNTFNSENLVEEEVDEGTEGETSWSPSGLEEGVKYYWRVKASDGSLESNWLTSSFTVNAVNDPPQTPVLTYPEDNKTVRTSSLTLKVNSAVDPDNDTVFYTFEICEAGGECTLYENLENPEKKLSGLSNNSEYEWAVKAVDEHGEESGWSETRIFKVITNYSPNPPRLNNPVSGGSVYVNDTIVLSVKNSTDADGDDLTYNFEIYGDKLLSDLVETGVVEEGKLITEYTIKSDLSEGTTYYWRVYATDGENKSSYSSTFNFVCSSEEPEYSVDVVESRVVYSSMLEALDEDEYYDVSVDDASSALNGVTISIPNGAVNSDLNITIGEVTAAPAVPSGVVVTGRVIHFGPEGTVFNNPVIIKIPYTQYDLTAAGTDDPGDLRLYTYSSSATGWEILEPEKQTSEDITNSILRFEVSHFSIFTFGVETDDTGTPGGSTSGGSSGGGGGCFISTAAYSSETICSVTQFSEFIWGLLLFGALLMFLISRDNRKERKNTN